MEDRSHILERAAGVVLPADYRRFLNRYDGGARLTDGTMRFALATAEVLAAPFPFDRPRIDRPLFEAHFIYLGRMRDAGVMVFDGGVEPIAPGHFARMITIGFGERPDALDEGLPPTHVIVLDPMDGSVRLAPIDPPAVVRRVEDSFGKWFRAMANEPKTKSARPMKKKVTRKARATPAEKKVKQNTSARRSRLSDHVRSGGIVRRSLKAQVAPKRIAAEAPKGVAKPALKGVGRKRTEKKQDVLAALKRRERLTLPAAVERRLRSKSAKRQVVRPDGRAWTLATPEDLAETGFRFSEWPAEKPMPFVRCTRAFADLLKAAWRGSSNASTEANAAANARVGRLAMAVPIAGEAKKKFTLARLRKGVCIGASQGNPLFLDPTDQYSVWTFAQETNTVTRLANRFEDFVKPVRLKKQPAARPQPLRLAA